MKGRCLALFGCAIVLGLAGLAGAQEKPGKPDKPAKETGDKGLKPGQVELMKERLALTDEQAAKVKDILKSQDQQLGALKNDTTLAEEQKRAKFAEIAKATNDAIAALLTPEQKAKWEELQKAGRTGKDGAKDGVAERVNSLVEKLGLTDDQKAKLTAIYQKQNDAVKAANKEAEDAARALLTPEQKAKWEELQKAGKPGKDAAVKPVETPRPPKDAVK